MEHEDIPGEGEAKADPAADPDADGRGVRAHVARVKGEFRQLLIVFGRHFFAGTTIGSGVRRRRPEIIGDLDAGGAAGTFDRFSCKIGFGLECNVTSGTSEIHVFGDVSKNKKGLFLPWAAPRSANDGALS